MMKKAHAYKLIRAVIPTVRTHYVVHRELLSSANSERITYYLESSALPLSCKHGLGG